MDADKADIATSKTCPKNTITQITGSPWDVPTVPTRHLRDDFGSGVCYYLGQDLVRDVRKARSIIIAYFLRVPRRIFLEDLSKAFAAHIEQPYRMVGSTMSL